jgi:hypothetical protein
MTQYPAPAPRPTNTATHRVEKVGLFYVYVPIKPAKP